jgi:hypothetical protein
MRRPHKKGMKDVSLAVRGAPNLFFMGDHLVSTCAKNLILMPESFWSSRFQLIFVMPVYSYNNCINILTTIKQQQNC